MQKCTELHPALALLTNAVAPWPTTKTPACWCKQTLRTKAALRGKLKLTSQESASQNMDHHKTHACTQVSLIICRAWELLEWGIYQYDHSTGKLHSQHFVPTLNIGFCRSKISANHADQSKSVIRYIIPNYSCFSGVRRCSLLQHVSRRLRKLPWVCAWSRGTFRRPTSSPFSWLSRAAVSLTDASYINTSRSYVSLARPSPSSFLRHGRLPAAAAAAV